MVSCGDSVGDGYGESFASTALSWWDDPEWCWSFEDAVVEGDGYAGDAEPACAVVGEGVVEEERVAEVACFPWGGLDCEICLEGLLNRGVGWEAGLVDCWSG